MPFALGIQVTSATIEECNAQTSDLAPNPPCRLPAPTEGALLNLVCYILNNSLNGASSISIAISGTPVATLPLPEGTDGLQTFPLYYPIPPGAFVSFICNTLGTTAGGITFNASSLFIPTLPPPP